MDDPSTPAESDADHPESDPTASGAAGDPDGSDSTGGGDPGGSDPAADPDDPAVEPEDADLADLRAEVEEKYDFDEFGPADMARMSPEEWDVSFDPDTWTTGTELLDRVENELKSRIGSREVFAVLERVVEDGEDRILAYSDAGYVIVYPDGTIEGRGTVLEDVKPTVALCSIPEYEPPEPPEDYELPDPEAVPERSGEFGNRVIQVVAFLQLIGALALIGAWLFTGLSTLVAPTIGLIFLAIAVFLFATVANARLSDRFRADEYRERLRDVQLADGERPEFVPIGGDPIDSESGSDDVRPESSTDDRAKSRSGEHTESASRDTPDRR